MSQLTVTHPTQDARNALIAFIRETPGKAAFLALLEIARAHPDEQSRPWMGYHAKARATADADVDAWTPAQVQEFGKSLVATPQTIESYGITQSTSSTR